MGLEVFFEEYGEKRLIIDGLRIVLFGLLVGIGDVIIWFIILLIVVGIIVFFVK